MASIAHFPAANARDFSRRASQEALNRATAAAARVHSRTAPIRRAFVRSDDKEPPPVAAFLRGGRGGEVRLKLYLTMLWIAANPPHDTSFPARLWAELLDLPDPERRGSRRIKDAMDWLHRKGFVRPERRPGYPSTIYLLDDGGRRAKYGPPGGAKERYIQIPPSFWKNGWIATLSGTAVALLLILLDRENYKDPSQSFWISPTRAKDLYSLSPDTWTKGIRELKHHSLVTVSHTPVSEEFGFRRVRNVYRLDRSRLDAVPGSVHVGVLPQFGR